MPSIAQNRLRLAPMTGRQALAAVREPGSAALSAREISSPDITAVYLSAAVWEAEAHARLGHEVEAQALAFERDLAGRNKGDATQFFELAQTLYVTSLTYPAHATALRREALGLIDRQPAPYRALRSIIRWRRLILQT